MESPDFLDLLVALEADVMYREPPAGDEPPFRYMSGTLPVLLSAPHGAAHRRDGRYKQEDEYTTAFARLLAERTGAHVIYAFARSEDDPNWDRVSPYKAALAERVTRHGIRFVIDIHGMSNRHKFGIAVGTMCGASCRRRHETIVVESLASAGFVEATANEAGDFTALHWDRFVVNHGRFTGGITSHTVTRFAAEELGIYAVQIELCAGLRIVRRRSTNHLHADYQGDPAGIGRALLAFERLVAALAV